MIKKKFSLKPSRHIDRAIRKGIRYQGPCFRVCAFVRREKNGPCRICVILPAKRFKSAVLRNRIRRQIKAAFRKEIIANSCIDLVVFPRENNDCSFAKLEQQVKECFNFLQSRQ